MAKGSTVHCFSTCMKKRYLSIILIVYACHQPPMDFQLLRQTVPTDVPSASGMASHLGFYYTIGDDSPYLFKLDRKFVPISKIPILSNSGAMTTDRIPKKDKPDFEAMEMIGENELLVFGSGSRSPERERFLRIYFHDSLSVKSHSLSNFYGRLKKMSVMKDSELNIEAVAYDQEELFLFNRRKNVIFRMSYPDFINFLESDTNFPKIDAYSFELPKINGVEAGFSGATVFQKERKIIITASVEDTDNAYDDGEILGSLLGMVRISDLGDENAIQWCPIKADGKPLKVESVCIDLDKKEKGLGLVLTTDSDGGPSLFLQGILNW